MPVASERFVGGTVLHKELQGFVSLIAFQTKSFRNGTAMSKASQYDAVAKQYFGIPDDEDSAGLCKQLIEGAGIFAHLFDVEERIQTDPQGATKNCKASKTIMY